MANILDFQPADDKRDGSRGRHRRASSCEIVIFPGVRREPWETTPKSKPKTSRKHVKRDTLEIKD